MPSSEKNMIHQKRGTWWAVDPKKGKKGFASEEEAKTWAAESPENPEPKEEPKVEEDE